MIQFLNDWNGYERYSIWGLAAPEEARLISIGLARNWYAGIDGLVLDAVVQIPAELVATPTAAMLAITAREVTYVGPDGSRYRSNATSDAAGSALVAVGNGSSATPAAYTTAGDVPITAAALGNASMVRVYNAGSTVLPVTIDASLLSSGRAIAFAPAIPGQTGFYLVPHTNITAPNWVVEGGATVSSNEAESNTVYLGCFEDGKARVLSGKAPASFSSLASLAVINMSVLGDSITDDDAPLISSGLNGPAASGIGNCVQTLSMGRLRLHTCRATGGMTIANIATTHLPQIIADAPNCCYVLAGANDTYGAATPDAAAVIFARLRDLLWKPLMDAGIAVFAGTILPSASRTTTITAAQHAAAHQVNELIRAAELTYPNLRIVDADPVLSSVTGANEGVDVANYVATESTYLHLKDSGAMRVAGERWRMAQQMGVLQRRPEVALLRNIASVGTNPGGDGNNATGTNGTVLNAGVTGTGPDGWTVGRSGTSTAVVTPGAQARADGRPGQLVQVAATIGGAGEYINALPMSGAGLFITGSSSVALRQNSAVYVKGTVRRFSGGAWFKVLTSGTSAASEPGSLPTSAGGLVVDNTVTWIRINPLVAGSWVRTVAELIVSAHSVETIHLTALLKQYTAAYGNLAAGVVFEQDRTTYTAGNAASAWGTVYSHAATGHNGYRVGALALGQMLRFQTPWVQIASDCGILEPSLRLHGGAAAQATIQIAHLDMQTR